MSISHIQFNRKERIMRRCCHFLNDFFLSRFWQEKLVIFFYINFRNTHGDINSYFYLRLLYKLNIVNLRKKKKSEKKRRKLNMWKAKILLFKSSQFSQQKKKARKPHTLKHFGYNLRCKIANFGLFNSAIYHQ